jgi:hypothetical protein
MMDYLDDGGGREALIDSIGFSLLISLPSWLAG